MQTTSCPTCGETLPESTGDCAECGKISSLADATVRLQRPSAAPGEQEAPPFEVEAGDETIRLAHKELAWSGPLTGEQEALAGEDLEQEAFERSGTWQKVVTTTPHTLPALAPHGPGYGRRARGQHSFSQHTSSLRIWLSSIVVMVLALSGVFALVISLKHATPPPPRQPTLQVEPSVVALGGIVTLRGTFFPAARMLALGRDQRFSLLDTSGMNTIQADAHGSFSDTVVIDPSWLAGKHTLSATDTRTRHQATFALTVIGENALQGPPHLLLSAESLNFGAGDETANANELLALSNGGGGQLTWQASSGQSWLQIAPGSGTIPSGEHMTLTVALDRSALTPGTYTTNIVFTSNTEQITLPVSMRVIPLQPEHQAVLDLSPAVLSFDATDFGPNPSPQTLTISNPGVRTLLWGMQMAFQNNNGNWLLVNTQGGALAPGGQQQILVSVNIQGLAPGVYKGVLLFSNQGAEPIQGNAQSIPVSLSIAPPCTLAFSSNHLSFIGVHGQAGPAPQTLQIALAPGCSVNQQWSATDATVSGGNWLGLGQSSGSTPAQFQVSVNTAGLAPATYTGTLTFTTRAGQQMVQVTLVVNPVACVINAPTSLTLQGTAGQSIQSTQSTNLDSSGDCLHALNWTSSVTINTPSGGTWLSVTPSGSFTPPAQASVTAQANLAGLSAGTYIGTVTISAVDSVTNQSAGTAQIAVTLNVLAPCSAQAPSSGNLSFTSSVGSDPSPNTASFTISVTGNCAGNVTITPTIDASGNGWLAVSSPVTLVSGDSAAFTVTITASTLAAGTYTSTITFSAADGNGAISGSPQTVTITLTVQ